MKTFCRTDNSDGSDPKPVTMTEIHLAAAE